MPRSATALLVPLVLGCTLVALGLPEAHAQSQRGRQVAPSQEAQSAPTWPDHSDPAGTGLPSYAQPSNPPSSFGPPPSGSNAPGGNAQTSSPAPGTPTQPNQVPLGGAEYLAAAGAAYALNRLRKNGDDEDEEDDDMP